MQDVILLVSTSAIFIFGYFLMNKLDVFLENNFEPITHNVNIEFFTNIQLSNRMVRPIFGNGDLKHGMIFIQFYVIENVIRTVTDCCPLCELFFRVDYFGGTCRGCSAPCYQCTDWRQYECRFLGISRCSQL